MSELLPDAVLAQRAVLPLKPEAVTLEGRHVRLVPYDEAHDAAALYAVSDGSPITLGGRSIAAYDPDVLIWRWMAAGPFADVEAFAAAMRSQVEAANGLPFTVIDRETAQPIGMVNYLANMPDHLKIELGSIWYSPIVQRTAANTEAVRLLLRRAFMLGYRRVEWKCDAINTRSRRAAERLGFSFEGIQEAHYIVKGRNRDTAWFRILEREWPTVERHLEQLLLLPGDGA